MSLSVSASNTIRDIIILSDDSDGSDSSKTHGLTSVADNETLIWGFVEQEVDQEITSHPTRTSQPVKSYQLASPPRTIEEKEISSPTPVKSTMIPRRSRAPIPRKRHRVAMMRASNDYELLKERMERSTKKSALPKRKKSAP